MVLGLNRTLPEWEQVLLPRDIFQGHSQHLRGIHGESQATGAQGNDERREGKTNKRNREKIPFLEGVEEICVLPSQGVVHSHQSTMLFASTQLLGGLCMQGKARCDGEQSGGRALLLTQEMKGEGSSQFS